MDIPGVNDGYGVRGQVLGAVHQVAGRGDRDAVLEWVDSGGLFVSRHLHEERSETETAPAEDIYVRPVVFEDLGLKV